MLIDLPEVYHADLQRKMQNVYNSFSEKDRRRYAAAEALKLGYGGIAYIARLFGCSRESINHGLRELDQLPNDPVGQRIRRPGAGRKTVEEKQPEITAHVQTILQDRTAGWLGSNCQSWP